MKSAITLRQLLNKYLDRSVRPVFRIGPTSWSAFHVCGCVGLVFAVVLTLSLTASLGLSYWVLSALVVTTLFSFFSLAMVTKIIVGEERLIYYHQVICAILTATLLLWLIDAPILAYLDITILGMGALLFCGRIGCLMAGCCHGRPHNWGVCYTDQHVHAGFASYYAGVRLFPIQVVESLWVFAVVVVGTGLVVTGAPAGAALAWYVISYDFGRFFFEFKRGDEARPYCWGYSESQWISVSLMVVIVALQWASVLPLQWWHLAATASLIIAMGIIAIIRGYRKSNAHELRSPRHLSEIASTLEHLASVSEAKLAYPMAQTNDAIHVAKTSLGVRISNSVINDARGTRFHYALSREGKRLTLDDAREIARIISQITNMRGITEFIRNDGDVVHFIMHPSAN